MQPERPLPLLSVLTAALLAALSTGCSPRIYTVVQSAYPSRPEGSPVLVYDLGDSLPERTEVIGNLRITDSGFTTGCGYDKVLGVARDVTNESGGNGLHLTWHKKPSFFGSSCHQIAADMLRVSDSAYLASYPDNIAWRWNEATASAPRVDRRVRVEPAEADDASRKPVTFALTAEAGYGGLTSKFFDPDGFAIHPYGLDLGFAFQMTGRRGIGGGLRYAGFFTSYRYKGSKFRMRLHHIDPELVVRQPVGRSGRWELRGTFGLGCAVYSEKCDNLRPEILGPEFRKIHTTLIGFGVHAGIGFDYLLTPSIAIGFGASYYVARLSSADRLMEQAGYAEVAGISRADVHGGLRFYF